MPDPPKKIVQVNGVGVVEFPHDMPDDHISQAIKSHRERTMQASVSPSPSVAIVGHDSKDAAMPAEIANIQRQVGAELVQGKPYQNAIATVGEGEPHRIEINDPARFKQGEGQVKAHELTHLLMNQMAGPIRKSIPPDDPKAPYDISNVDALRKQGKRIWQLPQEQAASIVQTYTADPSSRARLQPWIDDLRQAPLSVVNPTSPQDKNINLTPRIPIAPPEGYLPNIKAMAAKLRGKQ